MTVFQSIFQTKLGLSYTTHCILASFGRIRKSATRVIITAVLRDE